MVKSCSAYNCTARFKKNDSVSFHMFPKDPKICHLWLIATKRKNWVPGANSYLCSRHFTDDCFDEKRMDQSCLRKNAIPTVFDFPDHLKPKVIKKRCARSISTFTSEVQASTSAISHYQEGDSCHYQECSMPDQEHGILALPDQEHGIPAVPDQEHGIPALPDQEKGIPALPDQEPSIIASPNLDSSVQMKRVRYVCDCVPTIDDSPQKLQKKLKYALEVVKKKTTTIRRLQQQNRRLKKKCKSISEVLKELKSQYLNSESTEILENCSPVVNHYIKKIQDGCSPSVVPAEVKAFALTLHFYSSKGYDFVRGALNNCLPHPTTLRKWCQRVDVSPGFTDVAFKALTSKVADAAKKGKVILCALIVDEMAIRQQVEWDGNKYHGFVDFGTLLDDDCLPEAKDALVFMLVALNESWKIPIGYFLIDGLGGSERANLVNECLTRLSETGVEVQSLTFDGAASNMSMARSLGADFSINDMKNYFNHPITNKPIFILLDACHMLKLVRNTLAEKYSFVNGNNEMIKWMYIQNLHKFQSEQGLHAANKLKKQHIEYKTQKMKVKLAAQVFSSSVADAISLLTEDLSLKDFHGSAATVEFIRLIDALFDILNTRNILGRKYKAALRSGNEANWLSMLNKAEVYLTTMKDGINGVPLTTTNRKTGFIGLIVCIKSVRCLFYTLVKERKVLSFLLTFKLSQDHLELFFSAVRNRGGHNNNPTAKQFNSAYKMLLMHHELKHLGSNTNCSVLEKSVFLNLVSEPLCTTNENDEMGLRDVTGQKVSVEQLSNYVEDVVAYIAGFVVRKIKSAIGCNKCSMALIDDTNRSYSKLLNKKNEGGLIKASKDVINLCKIAEKVFRQQEHQPGFMTQNNWISILTVPIMHNAVDAHLFPSLTKHILNSFVEDNHLIILHKTIIKVYLNLRFHHRGQIYNQNMKKKKVRNNLNKLILFNHD